MVHERELIGFGGTLLCVGTYVPADCRPCWRGHSLHPAGQGWFWFRGRINCQRASHAASVALSYFAVSTSTSSRAFSQNKRPVCDSGESNLARTFSSNQRSRSHSGCVESLLRWTQCLSEDIRWVSRGKEIRLVRKSGQTSRCRPVKR